MSRSICPRPASAFAAFSWHRIPFSWHRIRW
jgi:hypothetical protein